MELKNGPISVFHLVGYSIKTANQSFGACLLALILTILFFVLVSVIFFFSVKITHSLPFIFQIPFALVFSFIVFNFQQAIIHIIASKIEKTGYTVIESLKSSIVPTFYYFVSGLILTVPALLLLFLSVFSGSKVTITLVYIGLCLAYFPFLMFLQPALVLRQLGPIAALKYAWEVGYAFYLRILLTVIAVGVGCAVIALSIICLLKATVPAWADLLMAFATRGNKEVFMMPASAAALSMPLLVMGGVLYAILSFFVLLTTESFKTILFLNLDYTLNGIDSTDSLPSLPMEDMNNTSFENQTVNFKQEQDLPVEQEGIHTESLDEDTLRHLSEVYNPQEHLDQAVDQEEDRMPTILFDDEMLKQLAENEKQMRERQERAQQQDDNTPDSIKMSDKTL